MSRATTINHQPAGATGASWRLRVAPLGAPLGRVTPTARPTITGGLVDVAALGGRTTTLMGTFVAEAQLIGRLGCIPINAN